MILNNNKSLLGKGISFPYNQSETGGLSYSEDIDRINQSLFLIFETPIGSRVMMPEFGSNLHKYRFDPLDEVLLSNLRYTITHDIKRWEPRISVVDIEFLSGDREIDNGILYISITYHLINSTVDHNYVYPYKMSTYDTLEISYD